MISNIKLRYPKFYILLLTLLIVTLSKSTKTPSIESGKLYLQIYQTPNSEAELFQLSHDSSIKSQLKLTQSSRIQIEAKMKFGVEELFPQLISVRLVHAKYDKLTQPVKMTYDSESQSFKAVLDLGNPRTIQPYSDVYKIEFIIADSRFPSNLRTNIATARISFRHSISQQKIPNNQTPISYALPSIIRTNPPEQRIDPPAIFTIFIVILMSILTLVFLGSLFGYLKVNFRLLPSDGVGLVLNLLLIGLLVANSVFLGKFWLEWNFITTIVNLSGLVLLTALVANYALLYLKNRK